MGLCVDLAWTDEYVVLTAGGLLPRCYPGTRKVVGATGFEPATPCAQGRCATRLRYAPTPHHYSIPRSGTTGRAPQPPLAGSHRLRHPRVPTADQQPAGPACT